MAVTQSSDGDAKQPVEGAELSCREGTVADACSPIQLRKINGPSDGPKKVNGCPFDPVKIDSKVKKNRKRNNKHIDDAEISGYLNSKAEIHYKTLLWEAINKDYKKAKKPKTATETKKVVSAERAAKIPEKMELGKQSEKINYNALKLLDSELSEGSETAQIFTKDSYRSQHSPQGYDSHGMHQDDDGFGYHDNEIGNEYVDKQNDNDFIFF